MGEYIIGDIYDEDGFPNWFLVPSEDDLEENYEKVIRCRDCKHLMQVRHHCICSHPRFAYRETDAERVYVTPSGFCAWGELKVAR